MSTDHGIGWTVDGIGVTLALREGDRSINTCVGTEAITSADSVQRSATAKQFGFAHLSNHSAASKSVSAGKAVHVTIVKLTGSPREIAKRNRIWAILGMICR